MTPERWNQVESVFQAALELPEDERGRFVVSRCGTDRDLRREVDSLLEAHGLAEHLTDDPAVAVRFGPLAADRPRSIEGRRFGPYVVIRELGKGGMGTVFLGARADREYDRLVAIKILSSSLHRQAVERFRAERQILAALEHPNIARLYEGGTASGGSPYLVMEYVDGNPIDEYCDRQRLSIAGRLALLGEVCAAVSCAHRNLVVHRDIKPSNILVTAEGVPKLLDFGIAKLLDPKDPALTTQTGLRPMTPAYASPEQLQGRPVTTATDIYSLGVVLYELLTGRLPYRFEASASHSADHVLTREPVKPSAAVLRQVPVEGAPAADSGPELSEIARRRSASDPTQLSRRLRGDLDSIVLEALGADPQRRYGSVDRLLEDLRRYREGLPILVRRATLGYRVRKFVRRHALPVALAAGLVILALGSAVATAILAAQIARQRDHLEQQKAQSDQVADFLTELFEIAEPDGARGSTITARELLAEGERKVAELADQPEVQAALLRAIGKGYQSLGDFGKARPHLENALRLRRQALGPQLPDVAESLRDLATLLVDVSDFQAAEKLLSEALAILRRALGEDHLEVASTLYELGFSQLRLDAYAAAEQLFRDALAIQTRQLGEDHERVGATLYGLGLVHWERRDVAAAEELYRRSLAIRGRELGEDHSDYLTTAKALAQLVMVRGDLEEADELYQQVLAGERRTFGDEHPRLAFTLNHLAHLKQSRGEYEAAERLYQEALAMRRKLLGDDHVAVAVSANSLASFYRQRGRYEAAEELYRESVRIMRSQPGAQRAYPLIAYGSFLLERGDPRAAEPLLREALDARRQALGDEPNPLVAQAAGALGSCLLALASYGEAEPLLLEQYRAYAAGGEEAARQRLGALRRLVELYRAWGRSAEAERYRQLLAEATPG